MDHFDFLSNMEQIASSKDSGGTEGDGNTEEDNGSSAQDVNSFSVDSSGLLGFSEPETQGSNTLFETNLFQISANPDINQTEPGDFRYMEGANEEQKEHNVTAESPDMTFSLENKSTFYQSESLDSGPIETYTSECTNSQFYEDTEDKSDASSQSGSTSSLESDGCTPWVQAVLVTNRTKETENCTGESNDKLFNHSDSMLTESPSTSEPLTPSFSEETDEELLKEKAGDLAQTSGAATTPDEVVMDPSDVAFLQHDVWHQNQAFVPISTTEIPNTEHEVLADKHNLEPVAMPMNCDPSSSEVENHGVGEALIETCYGPSTCDSASTLPSYIASVHKELVVWNNEPTETEGTVCFSFENQPSSNDLKALISEESLSSFCSPESASAAEIVQNTHNTPASGALLFFGSQDPLVREILRERDGGACQNLGASVDPQETCQMRNSEYTELLLCGCQETNQPPVMANSETWSRNMDSHMALYLVQEQDTAECTMTGNKVPINCTCDNDDKKVEELELNESFLEQEIEENEEITEVLAENDVIQTEAQPETEPETGIAAETTDLKILLANGNKPDREVATRLARKLYNLDGFKRTDVAPYLNKNNEFSQVVAEEYLKLFDFRDMTLDQSLRKFLMAFVLTGETQERERVLNHFSSRFHQCNPDIIHSRDAVHTMTCALMLLNTDLHGQNIGKSMSSHDFIINLEGMNDGKDFPKDLLKAMYHSIKSEKLEWAIDEEELQKSIMPIPEDSGNMIRITDKGSPFLEVPHDHKAATYKQGFLSRKVHADIDGKKTPWGKRSWKTFYAVLKGTIIYLLKDEYRPDKQSSEEAISIHHSLATKAAEYNKRPHVFRLQTADWRIFLFQAQSADQMNSWITRINLVAAMFSSPPFPAAIGSKRKFSRPILPSVTSKHTQEAQLESHDSMLQSISDDLEDHQLNLPDKKGKAKEFEEYKVKQDYLEYEKCRYDTYVKLLKVKLNGATDDLDKLEVQLFDTMERESSPLKKSHSSPSLNLESAPVVKVKRNVSERRTYRKIIPSRHRKLI
ncbi:PH and SEC7 domain-containing protein 4-like [Heptranchias perlo]|uniref:PH and SEC7 domain-containing protein 4-like n=1 Tax=Heptranchias perlo TaxID=212740 RepID=UPI00355A6F6A